MRLATGLNILRFLAYFREELTIVLATASSDAVLPQIMRKLERMGVKPSVVGLVVPTGYSFNLDAFSIYLTLATVFIAQATNTPLSFGDLLLVLGISLVTSKGAHGVPGSAIVILAATLNAVPAIPAIGLVLVLSVDWFIGMARALGNLIGNCVATVVIGAWEGDLDVALAQKVLRGDVDGGPDRRCRGGADPGGVIRRVTMTRKGSASRVCTIRLMAASSGLSITGRISNASVRRLCWDCAALAARRDAGAACQGAVDGSVEGRRRIGQQGAAARSAG